MTETIPAMRRRHAAEYRAAIQAQADAHITQTEAAKILDWPLTSLNNFIRRKGIYWPVIDQGRKRETAQ